MTVRFSQRVEGCLFLRLVESCSWVRPPTQSHGWTLGSFVWGSYDQGCYAPAWTCLWWTQALSHLWFTTRIGVCGSEGLVPKSRLLPKAGGKVHVLANTSRSFSHSGWVYGGISGFMALYLDVTINVDANDSKHLFTCWSVPGLSSSRRCLFMAFAHFKISVGANIHWLHEGVLGWTDVLNFSDVYLPVFSG